MAKYILVGFGPIARGKFVKYFRRIHRDSSSECSAVFVCVCGGGGEGGTPAAGV